MDNKQILETLRVQPLSEEEKASRHILGRLYGPIATCKESTRNGRLYNKDLWTKALKDEVFNEKVANKSLFLELGHPADREETDMTKVCACIPELPKIVNDDLYAYVDILDTPNGKLLKTFIDYGFVPGISSRGSGDIMANDEVDPETFFLETWDIVQLPAVKKARLSICESLDKDAGKLRKALTESYNNSSDEDKLVMKEALDNLNIKLEEAGDIKVFAEVPEWELAGEDIALTEDKDEEVEEVEETTEEPTEEVEEAEVEDTEETKEEETEVEEVEETTEAHTVEDLVKEISDYDGELNLEFKPIVIDDKEIPVTNLTFDDSEEGKLVVEINYDYVPEEEDNKEVEETESEEVEEVSADAQSEEIPEEAEDAEEEVIDDEADEVIESLKEMIRQKEGLEAEVKSLKKDKTVSDAEVATLKEELNKYKAAFTRTSELAAKSKTLEEQVKSLTEALNTKDATIKTLRTKAAQAVALTESVDANSKKVEALTESLKTTKAQLVEAETKIDNMETQHKAKLNECIDLAKKYKAKFNLVLNRYVESKASMLGVRSNEITCRLNEGYSLDDIDRVCEELLDSSLNLGRLNLPTNKGQARIAIKESATTRKVARDPDAGYDIDDDLLIMAGLKK